MTGDTIVALASGALPAAVAILRLSGPATASLLAQLAGVLPDPRRASLRRLRDPRDGALLDRGLVLWFPGPQSPTGEDAGELHLHGGRAVVNAVLAALTAVPGVRLAGPGEFARRAFHAGRMDLAALEGLADLVAAETEAQRRQAIAQADGVLGAEVEGWRGRLIEARALVEAALDFADEGDVAGDAAVLAATAAAVEVGAAMDRALAGAERGERLRAGFRVVLAGPPNAGKSSLLNALARRDVAIVAATPGTTRDLVAVDLDLAGLPVTVVDTAGLRDGGDAVEAEGMRRARRAAAAADLRLWLSPADHPVEPEPSAAATVVVTTKADLAAPGGGGGGPRLSVLTGEGLDALVGLLSERAGAGVGGREPALIVRERQRQAVAAARAALAAVSPRAEPELVAEDLRAAADALARVTGRIGVEDVLDRLFASFCIGK